MLLCVCACVCMCLCARARTHKLYVERRGEYAWEAIPCWVCAHQWAALELALSYLFVWVLEAEFELPGLCGIHWAVSVVFSAVHFLR